MRLAGKRIVCYVEHEFEDLELWYPVLRLREEGAAVDLAGPEANQTYTGKYGVPCQSDKSIREVQAAEYDLTARLQKSSLAPLCCGSVSFFHASVLESFPLKRAIL